MRDFLADIETLRRNARQHIDQVRITEADRGASTFG
jgi:hypothetical protein